MLSIIFPLVLNHLDVQKYEENIQFCSNVCSKVGIISEVILLLTANLSTCIFSFNVNNPVVLIREKKIIAIYFHGTNFQCLRCSQAALADNLARSFLVITIHYVKKAQTRL